MKELRATRILLLTAALCTVWQLAADPEGKDKGQRRGVVTATKLNMRPRPASNSEVLGQLRQGATVEILEKREAWLGIAAPSNVPAWVPSDALNRAGEVMRDVGVLAGPSVSYTTYARLKEGEKVKVLETRGGRWTRVTPPPGARVWVHGDYVDTEAAIAKAAEEKKAREASEAARQEAERLAKEEAERARLAEAERARKERERELAEREKRLQEMERKAREQLAKERAEQLAREQALREKEKLAQAEKEKAERERKRREQALREKMAKMPVHQIAPKVDVTAQLEYMKEAREVDKTGVIRSVGRKDGPWAHAITVQGKESMYIVAYLKADKLDLTKWEWKRVRLKGIQRWVKGWPRPQIEILELNEAKD